MKLGFLSAAALLSLTIAPALALDSPEVKTDELFRLGDSIQHVGGDVADPAVDVFRHTPADDRGKWFITIVGFEKCPPCKRLKAAFRSSEWLRTLAKPDDHQSSWAHFNYYDKDDLAQNWRFKKLKLTDYPTLLVQPPITGKYGPASTIVLKHVGYDGDDYKLAKKIADAIKQYVKSRDVRQHRLLRPPFAPRDDEDSDPLDSLREFPDEEPGTTPAPEKATPEESEQPEEDDPLPTIDYGIIWNAVVAIFTHGPSVAGIVSLVVLLVIAGLRLFRWWRKRKGEKVLVSGPVLQSHRRDARNAASGPDHAAH